MKLEDFRNWMHGEDCLVVGCGPSSMFRPTAYRRHWTIGCNRSVIFCHPDVVLCVEPFRDKEVWATVAEVAPLIVFTHLSTNAKGEKAHPRAVQLGSKDVQEWLLPKPYTGDGLEVKEREKLRLNSSAFFAASVATLLGFNTIGLIGVDLSPDRYGKDVSRENEGWARLVTLAGDLGSQIIQLNPESRLTSVPKGSWEEIGRK